MGRTSTEFERRRREDGGAEGAEAGVSPHTPLDWGNGLGRRPPRLKKKFDYGSQIGEFWCKLIGFCTVHLKLF